ISFGVLEVSDCANGGDAELCRNHLASVIFNGANRLVEIPDDDGAFKPDHAATGHQLATFLQQAARAARWRVPCLDQVEIRRTPGFKLPVKDLLIEIARAWHVVR